MKKKFFRDRILFKILYWKDCMQVLCLTRCGNIYIAAQPTLSLKKFSKQILEEGLFWTFKINIEYILVEVNLSTSITLEPLIKWWSWVIRLATFSLFFLLINFHFSRIQSISCTHWNYEFSCRSYSLLNLCHF